MNKRGWDQGLVLLLYYGTMSEKTKLPVAVGFGISKPSHVNELKKFADGAVIGSAIIDVIGESKKSDNVINVIDFISKLSK